MIKPKVIAAIVNNIKSIISLNNRLKDKLFLFWINVKIIIPIMSSINPAPNMAVPIVVFTFFSSINDSIVMLTEEAVRTNPMNV